MKIYISALILAFFCLHSFQASAQTTHATIEKNLNSRAKHLFHDLNTTKDTLILKSDKKIKYVYAINKDKELEVSQFIDGFNYEVPLHNLSEGKHLFVVEQLPLKIVFIVRIYKSRKVAILIQD